MKNIYITLVALIGAATTTLAATTIDREFELGSNENVHVSIKLADSINIIPTTKDLVKINGEFDVNDGENDEAYTMNFEHSDSEFKISSKLIKDKSLYRIIEILDEHGKVISTRHSMKVSAHFNIHVPVGRKLVIDTINADLNLRNLEAPMRASSINGEINLELLESAAVDVNISTINGECFTDMEFEFRKKNSNFQHGHKSAEVSLNDGGIPIHLKTINGHMFLTEI